ncbi:MAG: UDP-N-acetylglucosamine--N-acetylmuramyl-(pentapeptide) pyrophosphoryl-undecaprenol N-acetylglucosamine transferase [Candidatus Marinimicrobia bacterium]|nr:UDP-N-acetylglucosamine--N-acetylmuramyl-(pentapeptide) pyrophosphoryl-undecaprenol N-acetylglucosamine transferase [Candidatus Neomarinimicrobiota bacterium]
MVKKKIVITGGHLTPALAVIEELEKKKNWQIYFLGRQYASEADKTPSMETELLEGKPLTFIPLITGRVRRHWDRYTLFSYLKIPLGFFHALAWLMRIRPNIILSFSGYVSVPVVLAGWLMRIPILNHEQTAVYGLASQFNRFFANQIAVSWEESQKHFPAKKVVFTGNPIRKNILSFNQTIWSVFNFEKNLPFMFFTGGNQGSHVLNRAVGEVMKDLLKDNNVFLQVGHLQVKGDFEWLETIREKLPDNLKKRFHLKRYLNDQEMGTFLNKADLVVSRAGANIVTELAALGKPCLLIPLPYASADEQTKNAQLLVKAGTAAILTQDQLTPAKLKKTIEKMSQNLGQYQKKAPQAKKLVQLEAAEKMVAMVEKLAR